MGAASPANGISGSQLHHNNPALHFPKEAGSGLFGGVDGKETLPQSKARQADQPPPGPHQIENEDGIAVAEATSETAKAMTQQR
jgi:hypothetical protein